MLQERWKKVVASNRPSVTFFKNKALTIMKSSEHLFSIPTQFSKQKFLIYITLFVLLKI